MIHRADGRVHGLKSGNALLSGTMDKVTFPRRDCGLCPCGRLVALHSPTFLPRVVEVVFLV